MQNVRIFFEKTGDAKYISHLDLMRCFARALKRAEIPLWYTEGYNPRPYMNFAMPLSLGMEGLSEILDIRIEDEKMTFLEIKERLSKTLPRDIKIIEIKEPVKKAQLVAFSTYKIEIKQDKQKPEEFESAITKTILDPSFAIFKIGKQGRQKVQKEIPLDGQIQNLKSWSRDTTTLVLTLPSNPTFGINPGTVINRALELMEIDPIFVHITRKYMLDQNLDKFE